MGNVLYIDVFFFLNFLMDYISLYITARIISEKTKVIKLLFSAFTGAAYSVIIIFFEIYWIILFFLNLSVMLVMCRIAFGKSEKKQFLRRSCFLFLTSALIGGFISALYNMAGFLNDNQRITISVIVVLFSFCYTVWSSFALSVKINSHLLKVDYYLYFLGRRHRLNAFVDSGNMLFEPVKNYPVIIVRADSLNYRDEESFINEIIRLGVSSTVIPIKTAAGEKSLFVFFPEKIILIKGKIVNEEKKIEAVAIAIDFDNTDFFGCQSLMPSVIF